MSWFEIIKEAKEKGILVESMLRDQGYGLYWVSLGCIADRIIKLEWTADQYKIDSLFRDAFELREGLKKLTNLLPLTAIEAGRFYSSHSSDNRSNND